MRSILIALMILGLAGCSVEGDKVGGCIMHQDTSALAGVAWADCPASANHVYIPGQAQGYAVTAAPMVAGAAVGGGIGVGAAIIAPHIPQTLGLTGLPGGKP